MQAECLGKVFAIYGRRCAEEEVSELGHKWSVWKQRKTSRQKADQWRSETMWGLTITLCPFISGGSWYQDLVRYQQFYHYLYLFKMPWYSELIPVFWADVHVSFTSCSDKTINYQLNLKNATSIRLQSECFMPSMPPTCTEDDVTPHSECCLDVFTGLGGWIC